MRILIGIALRGIRTRLSLLFSILLAVGAGFLVLYANSLLAIVLNDYLLAQTFDGFATQLFLTTGVFVLVFGMNMLGAYFHADFQNTTTLRLATHYIAHLLRAKSNYFTNRPAAEIWTNLFNAVLGAGGVFGNILRVVSQVIIFVFYGIVVFSLDVYAGIFTVLSMPIYFLVTSKAGNQLSALMYERFGYYGEVATVTQEAFENINNVKTKSAYAFFVERSAVVLQKIRNIFVKEGVINHYIGEITGLIRLIAPLLIIFAAMQISTSFEANLGNVTVLYINIPLFLNGFSNIHRQYIDYKRMKPLLAKLWEYNDIELEKDGGVDIAGFESLQTDGVRVEFPDGRIVAVPDFEVKKGEKVMFFGESGVGKSTIFNIIMGLNQEYEGKVFINGVDLQEISLASLRRIFGITFQNTNALTLDLCGNMLLGANKTDTELEQLIKLVSLENQHKIKGHDILNNKMLSGGEKSRLGLSQMLALEPQIMLIDEAFSNVDEELEANIIANLFREYPKCTVICISHRNSSKPFFSKIVDFNLLDI